MTWIALNLFWSVTLWLAVPPLFALVLRHRAPEVQRAVGRAVLMGLPVIIVLVITGSGAGSPWIAIPEDTAVHDSALDEPGEIDEASGLLLEAKLIAMQIQADAAVDAVADDRERLEDSAGAVTPPAPVSGERGRWVTPLALLLWTIIALFGLLRLARSFSALSTLRRDWQLVRGALFARARLLARRIGFLDRFDMCSSATLLEAVACGVRRPTIVLPEAWVRTLDDRQLDPLVLHEIAHLESRDPLWRSIAWVATSLFWPHPLIHWLGRRERLLSEYAADRKVVGAGANRRAYARLLGEAAERRLEMGGTPLVTGPLASGLFGNRTQLEGRIRMILSSSAPRWARATRTTALITTALTLALGIFVTHPLIGTCDPCDPPTQKKPQQGDAFDLFVVDEGDVKGNLLHLVDLNARGNNQVQLADLFTESTANDGGKADKRRSQLSELMKELDRKKAEIAKLEAELARYQGDLERAKLYTERAASLAANRQSFLEKRFAETADAYKRVQGQAADRRAYLEAVRERLKTDDAPDAAKNYQKALDFLGRKSLVDDAAKAGDALLAQRRADEAAVLAERKALGDNLAKMRADMAAANEAQRNALSAEKKTLELEYARRAADQAAMMADREKVLFAEKKALEDAYAKLATQRNTADTLRADYEAQMAYMARNSDRAAKHRAVAVDLLQMVLARDGKLRDGDIAQIKQFLADITDRDLKASNRAKSMNRAEESFLRARNAKDSSELQEMRKMLQEFREMRDELIDLRNQIRADRKKKARSTDLNTFENSARLK